MGKTISINPVTRLEGHGKIDIFLNDQGDVEDAYFQVTEAEGFRAFLPWKTGRGDAEDRSEHLRCLPHASQYGLDQGPRQALRR